MASLTGFRTSPPQGGLPWPALSPVVLSALNRSSAPWLGPKIQQLAVALLQRRGSILLTRPHPPGTQAAVSKSSPPLASPNP